MSKEGFIFNQVVETWDLKGLMHKNQLFFMYSGHFDDKRVEDLIAVVEVKFMHDKDNRIKRKVLHIMIELLQNISLHRYKDTRILIEFLLVIGKDEKDKYFILTGNSVDARQEGFISSQIDRINSMQPQGLRGLYRVIMEFGMNSDKGGIGLGLINIARRSRNKIKYNYIPVNEEYKFFTLLATIETPYSESPDKVESIRSTERVIDS